MVAVNWGNLSQPVATGPMPTPYEPSLRTPAAVFPASSFGAVGDGVTDDAPAINAAIAAAAARGGGRVALDGVTYALGSGMNLFASFVELVGNGWSTVLKPLAGAQFDVITTGTIPAANANNNLQGIVVRDLLIDGSNMTATTAGQGNAIHFWGARQSFVRHVLFRHIKNYCVVLEGSLNGGYNDVVDYCEMDSTCAGGVWAGNGNEANWVMFNELIGCAQTLAAAQPAFGSQSTTGHAINYQCGICNTLGNVFGGGASSGTMNSALYLSNEGHRVLSNRFDGVEGSAIQIGGSGGLAGHTIVANEFKDSNLVVAGPSIQQDGGDVTIMGNAWVADSTAHYTYCIQEIAALAGNVYANNQFRVAGTAGTLQINAASTSVAQHNTGYNPVGHLTTQPTVPASGTAYTNTNGVDCTVYIEGGTVTAIAVGGTATGATSGAFRVAAGQTVTLTYSAAPTWQWFGD